MKKSIFLFFAAILCATSAWAAKERVYFVNTPGWTTVKVHAWGGNAAGTSWPGATPTKETSWKWNGKDVYYLEAEAGAYKNCIFNNNSGSQTADLTWKANNVYWFAKPNDKNSGDNKWIPVEVAQANTTGTKIYFVNKQGWSTVKVYAWGLNVSANANWSGTNMTKEAFQLNGYDVYSYTADKEYDFCIFNNGSSQTSDLYWYQGIDKYYYEGEGWMTQEQIGTPKTYKNIKITATVKSETAPTIWWWGAGDKLADAEKTSGVAWPGVAMTKEGDKYVYTFSDVDDSKGVNYLIVSDGIQGYNQHATDDTSVDFINMLPIVAAEGIGGKWGGENKLTPETQDNGYIANWTTNLTQGDHDIKVTIDKDGTGNRVWYGSNVITISRAENAKVFNDDANKGSDNGKLVADIAGDYTFTYTYKTQTLTVTYPELPTPEYKDITVTVYAKEVPNIWWWNGGDQCPSTEDLVNPATGNKYQWTEAPAMEAVVIDGNTWYQKKFVNVDVTKGGIKFKLQSADHKDATTNEVTTTEDKCYDARVIATVTETPCGQLPTGETPKVTYNVEVPAGTNTCYIAGEMNGWKFTDEMTKVDDTHYTITIEGATTAHKYKYTSGPDWAWVEVIDGDRTYSPNDVVTAWKAVYDPSAPVYDYYIVGSMNSWNQNSADHGMTDDNEDGIYEKKLTLKNNDEFKVKGNEWYGFDAIEGAYVETSLSNESDRNIKITLDADKEVTVKFNSETKKITFDNLTEKTPVVEDLSTQPSILYFHPSDQWKADNARFAAYFYGTEETWVNMTDADKDGIYEVVNDKKNKYVIFCRMNPDNNENKWGENGSHKWNQSADLEIPTTTYLNYWMVAADNTTWDSPEGKWMMLIGSGDNSEALTAADGQTVADVYVNRSFTAGQLYTIALPFDLSDALTKTHFGSTVSVIKFTQLEKDEKGDLVLWFNDALGMAAGKPYLITPSVSVDGFVVNNVDIKNAEDEFALTTTGASVTMEAVLSASKNATNNGRYWLASNSYLYNTSTALKSLRAVFNVQSTKANVRARVAFGENVETGVEDIFTTDTPVKAIVNGQLIIIRDGVKYNVQGQKL